MGSFESRYQAWYLLIFRRASAGENCYKQQVGNETEILKIFLKY